MTMTGFSQISRCRCLKFLPAAFHLREHVLHADFTDTPQKRLAVGCEDENGRPVMWHHFQGRCICSSRVHTQEYERTNMDMGIDFYQFGGSWVEQHWQWQLTMQEDNGNDNTVVSSVALTWFISPHCVWQLSNTRVLEIIQHFMSCTL